MPFLLEFKQSVKWLLVQKFGVINGVINGANNIKLNELESKVYEAIKTNQLTRIWVYISNFLWYL